MGQKRKTCISCAILIGFLFFSFFCRQGKTKTDVRVTTDPRVELMSLIFRLAGNPEYNMGRINSYNQDVESHFSPFKDHDVVQLAKKLRETRGVSYDAVMGMAVHVTDAFSLRERIPFDPQPVTLDSRWTPELAREFLDTASRFVEASDFKGFTQDHDELYELAASRMKTVMEEHGVVDWFDEFFGSRPGARFELILGMLNGPANYGARIKLSNGDEILYCILGVWGTDKEGNPEFSQKVLPTVVHEFCHSYCNPLVEKHIAELEAPGEEIFSRVREAMGRMAYGNWETMMKESLVRASVIRYLRAKFGEESAQERVQSEIKRQFFWMKGLSDLLREYEGKREMYASLDDFFPEIAGFFRDYAAEIDEDLKNFEKERQERLEKLKANSPLIVSMVPSNGAQDVDPSLQTIVVTFDRPMKDDQWAVMRLSDKFPEKGGEVFYDETKKVFTIPVKLKPDTEYELGLNADGVYAFASENGDPLYPVVIRFKTRGL